MMAMNGKHPALNILHAAGGCRNRSVGHSADCVFASGARSGVCAKFSQTVTCCLSGIYPPPKGLTHRQHQRSDTTWFASAHAKSLTIRHFISQYNFDNLLSGLPADVSLSHLCCVSVFDRAYRPPADCDADAFKPP